MRKRAEVESKVDTYEKIIANSNLSPSMRNNSEEK